MPLEENLKLPDIDQIGRVGDYAFQKRPIAFISPQLRSPICCPGNEYRTFSLAFAANGIWKDCYDPMTEAKLGRISGFSATIMPQWRFYWKSNDIVKLYSSVGIGLSIGSFEDNSQSYGSFQIGLLGFQIGRKFFVYGEAGCGYLYMGGKFGVGYRF